MRGLHYLNEITHNTVLRWRAVEHIVQSVSFALLWEDLTNDEKDVAKEHIINGDKDALKDWVKRHPATSIWDSGVRILRKIASEMKIPYYSQLRHNELCVAILKRRGNEQKKD